MSEQLYQTREFAKLAHVTVRTLHHYDRLGLLKPTRHTGAGYRLYAERDLARLQQIITLKFIGFSLKRIKEILERDDLDLATTLRLQRRVLEEQRDRLDMAAKAIEKAELMLKSGAAPQWSVFKDVIEVINMQKDMEWVKKYYTEEQLADLASRGTPEVLERGQREWSILLRDVDEAISEGVEPSSDRGQQLAARWNKLIEDFTGGDPNIMENLRKLYADQSNWPTTFEKPFSDGAGSFIAKAVAARAREN